MIYSAYYPYRSEAARAHCFSYLDSLAAKRWPVTGEERTIPTSYGATFVRINGPEKAPPVILLHGAGGTSLMWAPNVEALSAEYRTFAVDQVGEFGKSLCVKSARSFRDLAGWLNELFDGLELSGGVSLAGVSYGGALAAQYALQFPGRVRKVVLLAPGNTVLRTSAEFWARLIWAALSRRKGGAAFFRWVFADMQRKDPQWVDATLEELFLGMRSIDRHRPPMPPVLSDAEWRRLRMPALFLVGEHDVIYPAEKAVRRLRRVAPQVAAEIVPDAGHDFTIAHAAVINRRILQFLAEPLPSAPGNVHSCRSAATGSILAARRAGR